MIVVNGEFKSRLIITHAKYPFLKRTTG